MGNEIKRGGPFPYHDDESKLVGPYPIWDSWKHILFKKFPKICSNGTESLLKDFYIARRLVQKKFLETGIVDMTPINDFGDRTDQAHPEFFVECKEVIDFIRENTKTEKRK